MRRSDSIRNNCSARPRSRIPGAKRGRTSRSSPTAGNGIFRCGDRAPKPPLKCANVGRDQSPGIEWPKIPAETPYLASYRKRVVCKGWVVVCAVRCEPVSPDNSLISGNLLGKTAIFPSFCLTAGSLSPMVQRVIERTRTRASREFQTRSREEFCASRRLLTCRCT